MQKFLATLVAALAVAAVAVAPASAQSPAKYTQFGEVAAFNGAHQYAREDMGAAGSPGLKVIVDCLATRTGTNHRSSLWLCDVVTYQGRDTVVGHELVGVLRKGGSYVFRSYELAPRVDA